MTPLPKRTAARPKKSWRPRSASSTDTPSATQAPATATQTTRAARSLPERAAAGTKRSAVLTMRGEHSFRAAENRCEVVAAPEHRDRDARRLQPKQARLAPVPSGEAGRIDVQERGPSSSRVSEQERAGCADLEIEARIRRRPRRACSRVQEDCDLVARRVLQLLHDELPAFRGRGPVHPPERLSLDVLAHAVEIEAARSPQEQATPVRLASPPVREERSELDQARVDEERRARRKPDVGASDAEGVLDHGRGLLERIAATRDAVNHVPGYERVAGAPQDGCPGSELAHTLGEDRRRRRKRPRPQFDR